jgi:hypothetical protein
MDPALEIRDEMDNKAGRLLASRDRLGAYLMQQRGSR